MSKVSLNSIEVYEIFPIVGIHYNSETRGSELELWMESQLWVRNNREFGS